MPWARLELARIAPHAPQTCASTNSATRAGARDGDDNSPPPGIKNRYFVAGAGAAGTAGAACCAGAGATGAAFAPFCDWMTRDFGRA